MRELRDPAVGFFNVNTPEDLRRAEGMLAAAGDGGRRTASAGNDRPPLVCFVGYKDSGKTTFLESLVADMAGRGLHVACIKHDTHGFVMDHEGTDTWRLSRAGADQVVISAPGQYASVARVERERSLEELRGEIDGSADIVLVEGFKGADADKIEVVGASGRLACDEAELMAVVADKPLAGVGLPLFERGDAGEVARFICARYGLSRRSVEDEQ
jgi:molybdopterin-guanine dinucleotide biosynthesis protein MobB